MRDVQVEIKAEPVSSQFFAGLGWQLPPGGGRTAEHAYAGLGAGTVPPPGPLRATGGGGGGASERSELFGAPSAPAAAGALLAKVAGGGRGAEPPARVGPGTAPGSHMGLGVGVAFGVLGNTAANVSDRSSTTQRTRTVGHRWTGVLS